jgi:hypothetical protein
MRFLNALPWQVTSISKRTNGMMQHHSQQHALCSHIYQLREESERGKGTFDTYLSTSGFTPRDMRTSIIFFITAPWRHGCTDACFPAMCGWSSIVTYRCANFRIAQANLATLTSLKLRIAVNESAWEYKQGSAPVTLPWYLAICLHKYMQLHADTILLPKIRGMRV